ncbi:MAG TPA: rRNA maturation RNase YbeY [Paenibacillaceae bacterium]|nr:rRNA maturation RNase YbeY [Paenibacillaceae bacterium]
MSVDIEFVQELENPVGEDLLELMEQVLMTAAQMEEVTGEVVVTLVDNERIQELNRDYRGIDRATDVLSFAMNESGEDEPEIIFEDMEAPNMLGDIIISVPRAMEQASEYGHTLEREMGFLSIHGFLHLLGYDHQDEEEEKEMFGRQEEILAHVQLTRE